MNPLRGSSLFPTNAFLMYDHCEDVHALFLFCRSPVFDQMFKKATVEGTNEVTVDDVGFRSYEETERGGGGERRYLDGIQFTANES